MKVQFVSVTKPVEGTAESLIVYTARVSSPKNQENTATAPRLLKYLVDHRHWSPFELVDMTVEIETSRAISAQILRHKSFSFQEFSQRYATADLGFERYEARRQDTKNRQNSIDDLLVEDKEWFDYAQLLVADCADEIYKKALARGIAKEQARMVLPLAIKTRLYMKGSVRSWIHYFQARLDVSVQKEHRDVAVEIARIFRQQFPVTAEAIDLPR